jgi:hypothetical protein
MENSEKAKVVLDKFFFMILFFEWWMNECLPKHRVRRVAMLANQTIVDSGVLAFQRNAGNRREKSALGVAELEPHGNY